MNIQSYDIENLKNSIITNINEFNFNFAKLFDILIEQNYKINSLESQLSILRYDYDKKMKQLDKYFHIAERLKKMETDFNTAEQNDLPGNQK